MVDGDLGEERKHSPPPLGPPLDTFLQASQQPSHLETWLLQGRLGRGRMAPGEIKGENVGVSMEHPYSTMGEVHTVSGNARWACQHCHFLGGM